MATTAEKAEQPLVPRKFEGAKSNDLRRSEEINNFWTLFVPADTPIEDPLDSDFHAAYAHKLFPHDRIRVLWEDGTQEAELSVRASGRAWARVALIAHHQFEKRLADGSAIDEAYQVEFGGISSLYMVIRVIDSQILSKGHSSRQAAIDWLTNHLAQAAK